MQSDTRRSGLTALDVGVQEDDRGHERLAVLRRRRVAVVMTTTRRCLDDDDDDDDAVVMAELQQSVAQLAHLHVTSSQRGNCARLANASTYRRSKRGESMTSFKLAANTRRHHNTNPNPEQ